VNGVNNGDGSITKMIQLGPWRLPLHQAFCSGPGSCLTLSRFTTLALVALSASVHVLSMFSRWFLGMAIKLARSLHLLVRKIAWGVSVAKPLARLIS